MFEIDLYLFGGRGGDSGVAHPGIAFLKGELSKQSTKTLMSAYDELKGKSFAKMTDEEKMLRATVMDELEKRGKIVMDSATGDYVENKTGKKIVSMQVQGMDRSYRVNQIHKTPDGKYYADAEVLVNGRWTTVKGWELQKRIAQAARRKS